MGDLFDYVPILIVIPSLIVIACVSGALFWTEELPDRVVEHDLWYAKAPFGVCYSDVSGHFVWGSGSLSTDAGESYVLKYWEDGALKSMTVDASKTDIVVDGTFKIEQTYSVRHYVVMNQDVSILKTITLHLETLPENISGLDTSGYGGK